MMTGSAAIASIIVYAVIVAFCACRSVDITLVWALSNRFLSVKFMFLKFELQ